MATRESSRRFHFLKEIASGGFGSVYLAKVMHADGFSRLAAIKLLHQRWSENAEIAQRMRDEARLLGWLRHRNIVDVIDLTTIGGRVAVIMEYLEAIDFKGAINHVADMGEKMPPRAALEATAFVASALDAAYNRPPYQGEKPLRVIHRDIKPSNIMVDESGTVKVLDFGVARADFDHRESHTQELQFGSVDYMPPERLFFEPESPLSDVYSLGATLYELLALEKLGKAKGRPEKHAQFLTDRLAFLQTRCDLPGLSGEAVIELVREMCAYNHEGRPQASDLVQRCRALARGFEGEGLAEWAERLIPPLVKANREAPREPNPLTDSILSEDSASFKADDTFVDSVEEGGVVIRGEDPLPESIPSNDERWSELRQAALSEMRARGDLDPAAAFADGPTVLGRVDDEVEVIDESGAGPDDTLNAPAAAVAPTPMGAALGAGPVASVPPRIVNLPVDEGEPARTEAYQVPNATIIPDHAGPSTPAWTTPAGVVGATPGSRPPVESAAPPQPKPAAAPVRAVPATPDVFEDPPPKKRSLLVPLLLVAGVFGLLFVVAVVVAGSAYLNSQAGAGTVPVAAAPVASPAPAAAPAAPAPTTAPGGINFVSKAPDTAKITVSCDGSEVSGAASVGVAAPSAQKCSVKVMLEDRTRLFAEVAAPTAGTYTCFDGGAKECVR